MDLFADLFGSPPAAAAAPVPDASPPASATVPPADPPPADALAGLADAIAAVAPHADSATWAAALDAPMRSAGLTTPKRVAAFLGQVSVESGGLTKIEENLYYSAARLVAVFPHKFANEAEAAAYAGQPERTANRIYSGVNGNGDEASGDGWAFRGRGLLQLTGRTNHQAFAKAAGRELSGCPDWVGTPEGASASACWFWSTRGAMNALADQWAVSALTRRVNGPGMLENAQRISLSNRALQALGG